MNLLERLRYHGNHCLQRDGEQSNTMLEAAAEIERLRAALRDIALGPGEYILSQDDMQGRACDALGFVRVDAMEGAQDVG